MQDYVMGGGGRGVLNRRHQGAEFGGTGRRQGGEDRLKFARKVVGNLFENLVHNWQYLK